MTVRMSAATAARCGQEWNSAAAFAEGAYFERVNVDTAHVLRRIRPSASKAQKCGSQEDPRDHLKSVQHMDQLRPRPTWPCADLASCIHLFGDVSLRWPEASLRLVPGKALWVRLQELL